LILSGDKEVKNVVVSITNISEGDLGSLGTDFSLDQNGCIFSPHVQLLPVGVPIKIYNNDGILHNVHTQSEKNRAFNVAQPKFRKKVVKKFDAAERIRVKCDVHGWMQAFIVVIDHPFHAITGESGGYVIQGIPAGKYEIEFWHETLGNQVKEVEVAAGTETKLDLVYQADEK
jgi:plastocyanin